MPKYQGYTMMKSFGLASCCTRAATRSMFVWRTAASLTPAAKGAPTMSKTKPSRQMRYDSSQFARAGSRHPAANTTGGSQYQGLGGNLATTRKQRKAMRPRAIARRPKSARSPALTGRRRSDLRRAGRLCAAAAMHTAIQITPCHEMGLPTASASFEKTTGGANPVFSTIHQRWALEITPRYGRSDKAAGRPMAKTFNASLSCLQREHTIAPAPQIANSRNAFW